MSEQVNPEINQDRVFDTVDHFNRFGYIMFPEQVAIYKQIALFVEGKSVLEAGAGNCVGSTYLERQAKEFVASDKLHSNLKFAECLYPWMFFIDWDINEPFPMNGRKFESVVCIEAIEHVANPEAAIEHLLAVATEEVWISTPNGNGKKRPPDNPYHVCEYTPKEMLSMIHEVATKCIVEILHWKTFEHLPPDTKVNPLVYRIKV